VSDVPRFHLEGAVIAFDLDGTLVETAPDLIGALNGVLSEQDLAPLPEEGARHLIGRGARALLVRGFEAAGRELDPSTADPLVARFIEIYRSRIALESRPYPGCVNALDLLRNQGARLVVCTNKLTSLSQQLLDALSLSDRFEAIIGADAAPAAKPDPRHVLHAVSAAGGVPGRAVMVGDSMNDIASARAAGVPSIAVPFGYTDIPAAELGADRVIDHYNELHDAVQSLLQPSQGSAIGSPL
jgi:phosphoglycolate phosphatase